jgi:hypothetical protein
MKVIVGQRQTGKSEQILRLAVEHFAYIVCPTMQEVTDLWSRAKELNLDIPQPITWDAFVDHRYYSRGIKAFVIDNLDLCVQSMTTVDIKGVSLNG